MKTTWHPFRRPWAGRLTLLALALLAGPARAAKPATIPALQEWTDGSEAYAFRPSARVVLDAPYAARLAATGQVFQEDLQALRGLTLPVVTGTRDSLAPGDILLSLDATDSALGTEGYALSVGPSLIISARADAGAFYGTRTLLQLLKQGDAIPGGSARDFPRYPLRALHVDNGRKWITAAWLKDHIKELAYLKMNLFHWHLAEWNNFRLESTTHPEVTAAQHYSKAEVREMVALAAKYHVTIMPEMEMPGHMGWALAHHPELRAVDGSGHENADNLDLTKDASYTLVNDLLQEFLPLFPGPYFHLGTDEYITDFSKFPAYTTYAQAHYGPTANGKDVYLNFVNWAGAIVRAQGKTPWVWDDSKTGGSAITLGKDFILDSWTYAAQSEINQGYSLINCAQASLYYVWYTDWEPMQTQLYEQWAPNQWNYGSAGSLKPYTPGLLGAKLALWFDNNQCEEYSMAWGMRNSMRTVGQQTWASPKLYAAYADFKALSETLGRAPGTTFPATLPPIANPNGPYSGSPGQAIAFSSAGTAARNGSVSTTRWDFGDGGTSMQAFPAHAYAKAGTYTASLIVTDSNGMTSGNQAKVTVVSATPTTILDFAPASGSAGTTVTLHGTAFNGTTTVTFGGRWARFTVVSDTELQATVPAGAPSGPIAVTTPGGTVASATSFIVGVPAAPTLTGFSPASGSPGTLVTLTGTGLASATAVRFAGQSSTDFTVVDDATVRARVPAGAVSGMLSVSAAGGSATSSASFTVTAPVPAPSVSAFAPARGVAGTTVTLTGSGFTGATAVSFGGRSATFRVVDDRTLTATVPAGARSGMVAVTTPGGRAQGPARFLYLDLDGNGAVTVLDLGPMAYAYGSADAAADLDGDGRVGDADLSILLDALN